MVKMISTITIHYVKPNLYNLKKCDPPKFNFMASKIVQGSMGNFFFEIPRWTLEFPAN